ncbi:MAG: TIGR03663 family protein, partial [Verrucomicrobiae bacterium]|nr:TIGR03663 family protein [Verrucomicrobiae bacterium]
EASLRWLVAFAGGLIVLSFFLLRNLLGKDASFIALVFASVSPPLVYYNRYFIHESRFILFSLWFLYYLWRFVEEKRMSLAIMTGLLVGLLHAVRETVVLVGFAAIVAVAVSWTDRRKELGRWLISREGLLQLATALAAAIFVSVVFYSEFFTHWQGVLDSVLTYFKYSTEAGHEKPWYYYLGLILGERTPVSYFGQAWLLVLGVAGIWQAFFEKKIDADHVPFFRYITVYTLVTTVLYSIIAYKTPWLMLNFLIGWILLAAVGWVYLWSRFRSVIVHVILVVVLIASLGHSLRQTWLLSFRYSADPRNPFVYSHTSPDLINLVNRLETLSLLHPDGKSMRIDITGSEYWPLPWYLRDFKAVGYWQSWQEDSEAPVQIFSFGADDPVPELDPDKYISELRGLRDGVFLLIYIEKDLWDRQFAEA